MAAEYTIENPISLTEEDRAAHRSELFEIYGNTLRSPEHVQYPDADSVEELMDSIAARKEAGSHIALVDGAFDMPHPNHEWYLRHCRLLAAKAFAEQHELEPDTKTLQSILGGSAVFLAVTVDADEKVAAKKGGLAEKGGVVRPIYPWNARAERVAGYTFKVDELCHRSTVDLVTVEGDSEHTGTPLESAVQFASALHERNILDSLVVFGEHMNVVTEVEQRGITPLIIPEGLAYELNPMDGKNWSSSRIIRRAQGL